MTLLDVLAVVVSELDRAGIPHMVAGSLASTYHGEPRMTQDIDLVIAPERAALELFAARLDRTAFYVGDAVGAYERRDQFNLVDIRSGWKVDLIIRKERPFSRTEFARRVRADFDGVNVFVASAEDTVLAKLEWARHGGSERQLRDVIGVLGVAGDTVDVGYLRRWADDLGVREQLESALLAARG